MKKAIRVGLLAAGIVAALMLAPSHTPLAPRPAEAAVGICDPQQSVLCRGLVEWWNFEEATDSTRFGSYANTPLYEMGAAGVNRNATHMAWTGSSYSAGNFNTTSSQFRIPRFGSNMFTSYFTVAVWLYQSTASGLQTVLATTDGSGTASDSSGIILRLNAGKPELDAWEDETDTGQSYTYASAIPLDQWALVVWKLSPYGPYGKAQACISVNNAAFTCGDLTYNVRSSSADLTVGGRSGEYLNTVMDGLAIWSRGLSANDVALYYNSGSGRAFPFY
jgi:hypothetical protein